VKTAEINTHPASVKIRWRF